MTTAADKKWHLTGKISLIARLEILCRRLDKLLQGFVFDVGGGPFGDDVARQVAPKLHDVRGGSPIENGYSSTVSSIAVVVVIRKRVVI